MFNNYWYCYYQCDYNSNYLLFLSIVVFSNMLILKSLIIWQVWLTMATQILFRTVIIHIILTPRATDRQTDRRSYQRRPHVASVTITSFVASRCSQGSQDVTPAPVRISAQYESLDLRTPSPTWPRRSTRNFCLWKFTTSSSMVVSVSFFVVGQLIAPWPQGQGVSRRSLYPAE